MNYIPVIGWIIDLVFKTILSVPFWVIWTHYGMGEKYFFFLPEQFQSIPFWHTVGLFMAIPILLHIITPRVVSVSADQKNNQTLSLPIVKESMPGFPAWPNIPG